MRKLSPISCPQAARRGRRCHRQVSAPAASTKGRPSAPADPWPAGAGRGGVWPATDGMVRGHPGGSPPAGYNRSPAGSGRQTGASAPPRAPAPPSHTGGWHSRVRAPAHLAATPANGATIPTLDCRLGVTGSGSIPFLARKAAAPLRYAVVAPSPRVAPAMAGPARVPRAVALVAVVVAAVAAAAAGTSREIRACRAAAVWNLWALGDVSLTATEVGGPLAVGGDARLVNVSVNAGGACGAGGRPPRGVVALGVGGRLFAAGGRIRAGHVLVRRVRGRVAPSVGLTCAAVRDGCFDLGALPGETLSLHDGTCAAAPTLCRTTVDASSGDVTLDVDGAVFDALCEVDAAALRVAPRVSIVGRRRRQQVLVKVLGGGGGGGTAGGGSDDGERLTLTRTAFPGWTPRRTAVAFCGLPRVELARLHLPAAVFSPRTDLSGGEGATITGSTWVRAARGGISFRHAPYACDFRFARDEPPPGGC